MVSTRELHPAVGAILVPMALVAMACMFFAFVKRVSAAEAPFDQNEWAFLLAGLSAAQIAEAFSEWCLSQDSSISVRTRRNWLQALFLTGPLGTIVFWLTYLLPLLLQGGPPLRPSRSEAPPASKEGAPRQSDERVPAFWPVWAPLLKAAAYAFPVLWLILAVVLVGGGRQSPLPVWLS